MLAYSGSRLSLAAVPKVRLALSPGPIESCTRRQAIGSRPLMGWPSAVQGWACSAGAASVRWRPMNARRSVMQLTDTMVPPCVAARKWAAATTGSPGRRGRRSSSSARQVGSQRVCTKRLAKAGCASSALGLDSTGSKYEISSSVRARSSVLCSVTVRSSVSSSGLISTTVRSCRPSPCASNCTWSARKRVRYTQPAPGAGTAVSEVGARRPASRT